ncbi:MAG: uncharacterized protein A8A55_2376 [Amphiamblys sp. WSBS2006]|nr:MAG: uncharacterized protein A8A55_2376 [Amphiamblys sp. WSBS2006]
MAISTETQNKKTISKLLTSKPPSSAPRLKRLLVSCTENILGPRRDTTSLAHTLHILALYCNHRKKSVRGFCRRKLREFDLLIHPVYTPLPYSLPASETRLISDAPADKPK